MSRVRCRTNRFLQFFCLITVFLIAGVNTHAQHKVGNGTSTKPRHVSTLLNLKDFGAVGDGVADDSHALQRALDALASSGGGTLKVPSGQYALRTPVSQQFLPDTEVTIAGEPSGTPININGNGAGLDLTSEFVVAVGEGNNALSLSDLNALFISDISFVGVQEVVSDALRVIDLDNVRQATIRHCEFYGLASMLPGGAILQAQRTDLRLDQSAFLGCATDSGVTTSVVQNITWLGLTVSDCKFVDYGNRPGFFSKTPHQSPYSWINIGIAAAPEPNWPRREAVIDDVFLDEGGYFALTARPELASPQFPPFDVYISGLRVNVTNLASDGVSIYGARRVFIDQSHFGWSHNAGFAINLNQVGEAILDLIDCTDDATRLHVEADRLAVINSNNSSLQSSAPFTRVITTETAVTDPAQYVRQQYVNGLNHDPDPAGHFYWSDQIVRCDGDVTCKTETQAALTDFLAASPAAKIAIRGQVVDENDVPIPSAVVSLGGSEIVTTISDSNGDFAFTSVATAGAYMIGGSKTHYNFEDREIVTPVEDEFFSLSATLLRHNISGRVFDNGGRTLPGVTVSLTGPEEDTVVSDNNGDFSFADLPAGGDYVVSVDRVPYVFQVPSQSFSDLAANQYAVFVGEVPQYTISGQVTGENGSKLSGVRLSVSGTHTESIFTDSNGRYSLSGQSGEHLTIVATEPHYSFNPSNLTINDLEANSVINFTGRLDMHTIAGRVFAHTGAVLPNATVTLSGAVSATTTSDGQGDFRFSELPAGANFVITASRANYVFSVTSYTFNDLVADHYVAFQGTLQNYMLAGKVARADGTPVAGVSMTLGGDQQLNTTTNAQGQYSFVVPGNGSYSISPGMPNYLFGPTLFFTVLSANQQADFVASPAFVISGEFTTSDGSQLTGVTLRVESASGVTTLPFDGHFSLTLPALTDYTIIPSRNNYTFTPQSFSVHDLSANQVFHFTAELKPGVPVLLSRSGSNRALAIDSVLGTTEPFQLNYNYPWSADSRTRVMLFATHIDLAEGEGASQFSASIEDAAHRTYSVVVEYAGKVEGMNGLACIIVRLDQDLTDLGDVQVTVKYKEFSSDPMTIAIGH